MAMLVLPTAAMGARSTLLQTCSAELDARDAGWRIAAVDEDVAAFAKANREDPVTTKGDFDDDGREDVAMLVRGSDGRRRLAICLTRGTTTDLYLISDPYCGDGITVQKKGERYHDFDTETEGRFPSDGVFAYCFEKAGATWFIQNGQPHRIVNSD